MTQEGREGLMGSSWWKKREENLSLEDFSLSVPFRHFFFFSFPDSGVTHGCLALKLHLNMKLITPDTFRTTYKLKTRILGNTKVVRVCRRLRCGRRGQLCSLFTGRAVYAEVACLGCMNRMVHNSNVFHVIFLASNYYLHR